MPTMSDWVGYRVLIVGCGSIGRRHARNLKSLGVQQLGLCDTNAEALKECRQEVIGETFGDYEEALQRFEPEIVLICTPPVYHVDEALAALRANAHVFIEKPLSHESSGIQALIAEARRHDRKVQIGSTCDFILDCRSSRSYRRFRKNRARALAQCGSGAIFPGLAPVAELS